ncbi:hypothetical protein GXP70_25325 [Paenibacillus lycopersici]|uniref:GTP-binding protein n=1 Tax=Paenibacillus lycopersici TaxID=2704462 RepID=A0A6C0G755_9BACL|nr:CobW family GTP-binding protein [Paenibacillus lycopersici]QHT62955.1 hypothetical protein GXP70_25325 [Paenibacillus lycopersici]
MEQRAIPVVVLSGFLGSGKTTLLLRLLQQAKSSGLRASVLMNEIGAVDVDGTLVSSESAYQLMERITEGCLCCSKKGELAQCLERLALMQPDVIVMELTGVANPEEIVEAMTDPSIIGKVALHRIVTVIDAEHTLDYNSIFSSDRELIRTLRRQIEVADIIIANKADLISDRTADKVRKLIEDRNGSALFVSAVRCEFDASLILEGIAASAGRRQPAVSGTRLAASAVRPAPAGGAAGAPAVGGARIAAAGAAPGTPSVRVNAGTAGSSSQAASAGPSGGFARSAGGSASGTDGGGRAASAAPSGGFARSAGGSASGTDGGRAASAAPSGGFARSAGGSASGTASGGRAASAAPNGGFARSAGGAASGTDGGRAASAAPSGGFARSAGGSASGTASHAGASASVVASPGSFSRIRTAAVYLDPEADITRRQFEAFVSGRGNGCLRAKGYMPFGKDGAPLLFQLAGKRIEWSPSAYEGAPYFVMIGIDLDETKIKQEWARLIRK